MGIEKGFGFTRSPEGHPAIGGVDEWQKPSGSGFRPTGGRGLGAIPPSAGWGFTLMEVLLVVALLSVIAGLTVPQFTHTYTNFTLRKSAEDLAYLMRYAQGHAVVKNRLVRLEFDAALTRYWLTRQPDAPDVQETEVSFERIPGGLGQAVSLPGDVSVISEKIPLYFYPDGTIDKNRIDLCRDERCFSVSTKEQRGYVHVFETSAAPP